MKKTSKTPKSRAVSTKSRKRLRQLGGGENERNWLTMFAALILAVVLCALLVAFVKHNTTGKTEKYDKTSTSKQKKVGLTDPEAREDRIRAIYDSIELDESFDVTREDIFGEKRAYEWDEGRTYSSSKEYRRDNDVRDTKSVAKKAIEEAGFRLFDEPYAGSVASQYHFKNNRGEYVRLSVMSQSSLSAGQSDEPLTEEQRWEAPSVVVIKVNLDDNNE